MKSSLKFYTTMFGDFHSAKSIARHVILSFGLMIILSGCDGPKIDISGIVNIALKSHCDDVPLDTSLILHSLAETSTKLVSLRIKEVTDELEERLLLEVKQLEKRKQENFGKQPEETKEDITEVIKICEKHGLKGTFINGKQIIALSGHLLDFHDKVKKPPKDPKKIKRSFKHLRM